MTHTKSKNLSLAILFSFLLVILQTTSTSAFAATSTTDEFLAEYRGQVVLVDFWASWCGPCLRSFPWMNQMSEKYGDGNFTIVAVNVDKRPEDAAAFLEKSPAVFTIRYDPEGRLAESFGVEAMPSSFLIDPSGEIVSEHKGFLTSSTAEYERWIREQINQSEQDL